MNVTCPMDGQRCDASCAWWLGDGCAVAYVGANCRANMHPWHATGRRETGAKGQGGTRRPDGAESALETISDDWRGCA